MNRVVVLSRQAELSTALCEELRKRLQWEVVPVSDEHIVLEAAEKLPCQFIVADAPSIGEHLRSFLLRLFLKAPDTNVIALVGSAKEAEYFRLSAFGIQEIFYSPLELSQMKGPADRIVRSIASFDTAQVIKGKLLGRAKGRGIVAKSPPMLEILADLPRLAECDGTILIEGETGTGKDLIARAIHYLGSRAGGPFVTVDCGAIPDSLIENELFGHTRGAYTGASEEWGGLVRAANGGTIYVDEVETLPLHIQTRFLRLLQEREYRSLGQSAYKAINARIIASTNVSLTEMVRRNDFRKDLYHRLNVIRVSLPPLRERKGDIPALAMFFMRFHAQDLDSLRHFSEGMMEEWMRYEWPGNVRELENRVEEWSLGRNMASASAGSPETPAVSADLMTLNEVRGAALETGERAYFRQILQLTHGNISRAAKLAQIDRKNLSLLFKKRGIDPRDFRNH